MDGGHPAPPDPAPVQDRERVPGLAVIAQQAGPRVDAEDGEAVVRHPAGQHPFGQEREVAAGPLAETVLHRVADVGDRDLVQQAVADPVGLDHAAVQRVADAAAGRDQLQVRPGAGERLGQLDQAAVDHAGHGVLPEGGEVGGPAVAEGVRRVGVTDEHQRAARVRPRARPRIGTAPGARPGPVPGGGAPLTRSPRPLVSPIPAPFPARLAAPRRGRPGPPAPRPRS